MTDKAIEALLDIWNNFDPDIKREPYREDYDLIVATITNQEAKIKELQAEVLALHQEKMVLGE